MQLIDFGNDVKFIIENDDNVIELVGSMNEGVLNFIINNTPKRIKRKVSNASKALFNNPFIKTALVGWAATSIKNYNSNKVRNIKFTATSSSEEYLYDDIVKNLLRSGSYTKINTQKVGNYSSWELKKLK